MVLNKSRKTAMSRSDSEEHPKASTTHSIPLMADAGTYTWGFPHSGQNLALRAMGLPHSLQNFVSAARVPAAVGVAPPAGDEVDFFTASIMAWPIATPAPRPAPIPTAPPLSFPAAMGMDCAT